MFPFSSGNTNLVFSSILSSFSSGSSSSTGSGAESRGWKGCTLIGSQSDGGETAQLGKPSGFTKWSSHPSAVNKQPVDAQHFNLKLYYLGWHNWFHASPARYEMRILRSLALKLLPSYQWSAFSSLSNHSLCWIPTNFLRTSAYPASTCCQRSVPSFKPCQRNSLIAETFSLNSSDSWWERLSNTEEIFLICHLQQTC